METATNGSGSIVGSGDVVAGAGAEFQVAVFGVGETDFDFVVALFGSAGGRIAERILCVKLAADFIQSFFQSAVFEGGEVCAAGGCGCEFERVGADGIFGVTDGPHGERHQIERVVEARIFFFGYRRLARNRRKRIGAGRSDVGVIVLWFGFQESFGGGEADAVNGDVGELRLAKDFTEFGLAAEIGSLGDDQQDATAAGFIGSGFGKAGKHFDGDAHGVIEA